MKQKQNRPGTRAPHGAAEFTERITFYATAKQKRAFAKRGRGSGWARGLIDAAINAEKP